MIKSDGLIQPHPICCARHGKCAIRRFKANTQDGAFLSTMTDYSFSYSSHLNVASTLKSVSLLLCRTPAFRFMWKFLRLALKRTCAPKVPRSDKGVSTAGFVAAPEKIPVFARRSPNVLVQLRCKRTDMFDARSAQASRQRSAQRHERHAPSRSEHTIRSDVSRVKKSGKAVPRHP